MKTMLIVIAILFPLKLSADDLGNWYFLFLKSKADYSAEFFSLGGKKLGSSTGSIQGELTPDGTEFVERGVYTYQPQKQSVTVKIRWSKDEKGRLIGKYSDSEGLKITYTLRITSDTGFKSESKAADGRTMETIGQLRDDGKIHTEETMRDKDGVVAFTSRNTIARNLLEKKE